eukprot:9197346-Karenia_brevis.AAC.1
MLSSILDDTHEFITGTPAIIKSLAQFWSPVFDGSATTHNSQTAQNFLDSCRKSFTSNSSHNSSWDWSGMRLPDRNSFSNILRHSQDNSTGFDGLPFSAHFSTSDNSAILMEQMFREMRSFSPLAPTDLFEFNYLLQVCIPKKAVLPFEQGVACRAAETRSLSCKCTDNKIICKGVAQAMSPIISANACE